MRLFFVPSEVRDSGEDVYGDIDKFIESIETGFQSEEYERQLCKNMQMLIDYTDCLVRDAERR